MQDVLDIKEMFFRPGDERTVLSYCFKSIDYFYDLSSKVNETDFLSDSHQMLFAIFKELANSNINNIDLAMVINHAQGNGVLDIIGGSEYIQSISNIQGSKENFKNYIDNMVEASTKFKAYISLGQHMKDIEKNSQTGKTSIELINSVESNMLDMSFRSTLNEDPKHLGEGLDEFIEERKDKKIVMTGFSTGYPVLDMQIDGLIPGTLMVVAARKKMGKSTFLTNIGLYNAFKSFIPTLYIDTEMTFTQWQTRALSIISGIKERDIKHGGYNREQLRKLNEAKKVIKEGNIFHKYMPAYSVDKVVALCRKYKLKENIGLIIFDYLKEPDLSTADTNRKEYQLLGDITTKLKDLSGILNVPVLTAVQLNRQNDIADSDRIARYGDIISIWGMRSKEEIDKCGAEGGFYKLVIKDTRRGGSTPEEGIGYMFHKSRLTIREVPPPDQYFMSVGEELVEEDSEEEMYNGGDYIKDELA